MPHLSMRTSEMRLKGLCLPSSMLIRRTWTPLADVSFSMRRCCCRCCFVRRTLTFNRQSRMQAERLFSFMSPCSARGVSFTARPICGVRPWPRPVFFSDFSLASSRCGQNPTCDSAHEPRVTSVVGLRHKGLCPQGEAEHVPVPLRPCITCGSGGGWAHKRAAAG